MPRWCANSKNLGRRSFSTLACGGIIFERKRGVPLLISPSTTLHFDPNFIDEVHPFFDGQSRHTTPPAAHNSDSTLYGTRAFRKAFLQAFGSRSNPIHFWLFSSAFRSVYSTQYSSRFYSRYPVILPRWLLIQLSPQ